MAGGVASGWARPHIPATFADPTPNRPWSWAGSSQGPALRLSAPCGASGLARAGTAHCVSPGSVSRSNELCSMTTFPPADPLQLASPMRGAAVPRHSVGASVEYFSEARGSWIRAAVRGFDELAGAYILDVHPQAAPQKVRPAPQAAKVLASPAWHRPASNESGPVTSALHRRQHSPNASLGLSYGSTHYPASRSSSPVGSAQAAPSAASPALVRGNAYADAGPSPHAPAALRSPCPMLGSGSLRPTNRSTPGVGRGTWGLVAPGTRAVASRVPSPMSSPRWTPQEPGCCHRSLPCQRPWEQSSASIPGLWAAEGPTGTSGDVGLFGDSLSLRGCSREEATALAAALAAE